MTDSWLVTKCGEQVAAVELHALDDDTSVSAVLPSSTVMTPLVAPTSFMASASFLPISRLLLEAMVATSVISLSSLGSIFSAILCSSSTTLVDGLLDAAGQGHRVVAGGDHLEAFAVDGLGKDGGGGGAVAGHVAGLAGGFLDELRAMFS